MLSKSQRTRSQFQAEDGSLVMALLVAIIVAGLITVIVAVVVSGHRSTRFDESYTGAIHIAEGGIEEVQYKLNTGQISGPVGTVVEGEGELRGEPYEWVAEKIEEHRWEVVSEGGDPDNVVRTLVAHIEDQPLFDIAAFSDNLVNFTGANNADSYTSDPNVADSEAWCRGQGRVGSNDELDFSGGAEGQAACDYYDDNGVELGNVTVDGVDLYAWGEDGNDDPSRCVHNTGTPNNCESGDASDPWRFDTHDERVEFDDDVEWMEDILEECRANGVMRGDVLSSDWEGGEIPPADDTTGVPRDQEDPDSPYVYCAESLRFDVDTTLTSDASAENPVVFAVEEWIEVRRASGQGSGGGNRLAVNCDGCSDGGFDPTDFRPEAGALQLYTPASDGTSPDSDDVVGVRQHSRVAAAILAPRATCGGVGNAGVHIFGSMICRDIRNAGGWQFHFDEALSDAVRTGVYRVTWWTEE